MAREKLRALWIINELSNLDKEKKHDINIKAKYIKLVYILNEESIRGRTISLVDKIKEQKLETFFQKKSFFLMFLKLNQLI